MKAQAEETVRTHLVLPRKLLKDIDSLVGARGRSAFLTEVANAEVRKRNLLAFLDDLRKKGPAWKDEDHPEIVRMGTAEYVRQMRKGKSSRQKWLEKNWYNRK
jgi:hypothetical protein